MSSTTGTPAAVAPCRPSGWFVNPWFDSFLIVGTPLLIWPAVMVAQDVWSPELLGHLILLTATGHYFATFVRTYGDLRLFRRFRARFVGVPILLIFTCVWAYANGASGPLLLVTGVWAFWHWLAQAFGFARIYDARIGSFRPLTAFLDKALVVVWFVAAIALNPSATANFSRLFLDAGMALPGAQVFEGFRTLVLYLVVATTVAYLANVVGTMLRGERVSWIKQSCHVTTIGFYWFAFGYMPNLFVSYVLYELFHDVQYFAITWLSCRSRVKRDGVAPWMRLMFRTGSGRLLLFVVVMIGFGAIDMSGRLIYGDTFTGDMLKAVFLTTALLHYYYDGFIWRVRESDLRGDLGMEGGARARVGPGFRHAAAWGLFFVPFALLAYETPQFSPMERAKMLVEAAPESFETQANYAHALVVSGDFERGLPHYTKSIDIYAGSAQAHFNYAAALDFQGRVAAAVDHYSRALECRDHDNVHAQAHTSLGVCLFLKGERVAAQRHFDAARSLGGPSPLDRMTSLAAALKGQPRRAVVLYAAALELEPDRADTKKKLATLLVGQAQARWNEGRHDAARLLVDKALELDPASAPAHQLRKRMPGK